RAARRVGALRGEDAVEVAVIRRRAAARGQGIARGPRSGDQRPERALLLAGLRLPVEAVTCAFRAVQPLRVLEKRGAPSIVFALSIDVGQTHLDRGELVLADSAIEQLVVAGVGVPEPAWPVGHERDRERKVVVADVEHDLAAATLEPVGPVVRGHEALECRTIGDGIAGPHERGPLRPEDLDQAFSVGRASLRDPTITPLATGW